MSSELQDRSYDLTDIGGVRFDEEAHIYSNSDGEIYRSSTGILDDFKNKFDSDGMSNYKAIKDVLPSKSFNIIKRNAGGWDKVHNYWASLLNHSESLAESLQKRKKHYLDEWQKKGDDAALKGSIEHGKREEDIIENGFTWNNKYYPYSTKNILEITDTDVCAIPEILLWNHDIKLGGLADLPLIDNGYIHILDFKTNKEISQSGFNNQRLKKFLGHLPDCSLVHYSIQLKIYQHMACLLTGLKPGECWIISTANEEYGRPEDEYIQCLNMDSEVKTIFEKYAV